MGRVARRMLKSLNVSAGVVLGAFIFLILYSAPGSLADAPSLTITNLGQSSAPPLAVGQPGSGGRLAHVSRLLSDQVPPHPTGPPLGVVTATYIHKHLKLTVSVPATGKLTVHIPTAGRHRLKTIVRYANQGSRMAIATKVAELRWTASHRITIDLMLHAPMGFFTRTQTISIVTG